MVYDPNKVSYKDMLNYFLHHIDPTVKDAQFCDHGRQYRTAIFYLEDSQKQIALAALEALKKQFANVYTVVVPSTHFYPAEEYHQEYYQKNPLRYKYYRWRCGRDNQIKEIWHGKS